MEVPPPAEPAHPAEIDIWLDQDNPGNSKLPWMPTIPKGISDCTFQYPHRVRVHTSRGVAELESVLTVGTMSKDRVRQVDVLPMKDTATLAGALDFAAETARRVAPARAAELVDCLRKKAPADGSEPITGFACYDAENGTEIWIELKGHSRGWYVVVHFYAKRLFELDWSGEETKKAIPDPTGGAPPVPGEPTGK